MWLASRADDTQ
jgi:hypothetical protein